MILLAVAAAICPIDRTVYRLREAPRFQAGFARTPHPSDPTSDLRFFLKTPKRTYWFSFIAPNGQSGTVMEPALSPHAPDDAPNLTVDPGAFGGRGIDLDTFSARFDAPGQAPQSNTRAPAHLFSRDLRTWLWYDPESLAGDARAIKEMMPVGMFDAAGCDARRH